MKLLTELFESTIISEAQADGTRKLYVEGIFLQQEQINGNGRIYPAHILEREVARYTKEKIATGRAMGELGHPEGPSINLHRVSHLVKECRQDGNNHIGKALIIDTPYGKIAESLIGSGVQLGVSSRGMGTMVEDRKRGARIVQENFKLAVMVDIVADPSAPDAFVQGVMENVDWKINQLGEWVAEANEQIKKDVRAASKGQLSEAKVLGWTKFLTSVTEQIAISELVNMTKASNEDAADAMRHAMELARKEGREHDNRFVYTAAHKHLKGRRS